MIDIKIHNVTRTYNNNDYHDIYNCISTILNAENRILKDRLSVSEIHQLAEEVASWCQLAPYGESYENLIEQYGVEINSYEKDLEYDYDY